MPQLKWDFIPSGGFWISEVPPGRACEIRMTESGEFRASVNLEAAGHSAIFSDLASAKAHFEKIAASKEPAEFEVFRVKVLEEIGLLHQEIDRKLNAALHRVANYQKP